MGSGVLLAALVVLWFVVLVPMVVTRGDGQGGRAELADSGRTLKRRRTVDPVVHADTERVGPQVRIAIVREVLGHPDFFASLASERIIRQTAPVEVTGDDVELLHRGRVVQ